MIFEAEDKYVQCLKIFRKMSNENTCSIWHIANHKARNIVYSSGKTGFNGKRSLMNGMACVEREASLLKAT